MPVPLRGRGGGRTSRAQRVLSIICGRGRAPARPVTTVASTTRATRRAQLHTSPHLHRGRARTRMHVSSGARCRTPTGAGAPTRAAARAPPNFMPVRARACARATRANARARHAAAAPPRTEQAREHVASVRRRRGHRAPEARHDEEHEQRDEHPQLHRDLRVATPHGQRTRPSDTGGPHASSARKSIANAAADMTKVAGLSNLKILEIAWLAQAGRPPRTRGGTLWHY